MVERATPADAEALAELLDAFNREFDTPTPGVAVLAGRLRTRLAGDAMAALLADDVGFALISFRPSVWSDGPVGLLDELYVAPPRRNDGIGTQLIEACFALVRERDGTYLEVNVDGEDHDAKRFYARHGFLDREPGAPEPQGYLFIELG